MRSIVRKLTVITLTAALVTALIPAVQYAAPEAPDFVGGAVYADGGGVRIDISASAEEALAKSYNGQELLFNLVDESNKNYTDSRTKKVKSGGKFYLDDVIRCTSSNTNIAVPGKVYWSAFYEYEEGDFFTVHLPLVVHKPGKVTLTFTDVKAGEEIKSLVLNVTNDSVYNNWVSAVWVDEPQYGDTSLPVYAREGDTVTLKFAGKETTRTIPASGKAVFKIPVKRVETEGTVTFQKKGTKSKRIYNFMIEDELVDISLNKVKKGAKKVKVKITRARVGDVLKIKVGKKKYTVKIKKNAQTLTVTKKIKKAKKKQVVQVTLYNKFKQVRTGTYVKVK